MDFISSQLSYGDTNQFSRIMLDYLERSDGLNKFYAVPPDLEGIKKAIANRKTFSINRKILVEELKNQYQLVEVGERVNANIDALAGDDAFTIVTAHQPNIFTGPLYSIYKILHAIRLAEYCKSNFPEYKFVPVYYMGSEDADLDELGHFYLSSEKIAWKTKQTGAVGRMKVDKQLLELISQAEGQLTVLPFGKEIISLVRRCYKEGSLIQDATFQFLHHLFGEYGLIVLIADNASLKKQAARIFEDDLLNETASQIVEKTATRLQDAGYKLQANPREINLFYLKDDLRERIVKLKDRFSTHADAGRNPQFNFNKDQMLEELGQHPERFSPNVILRGIYQELILPNLAYIGGGGEIAYWLQLKDLFEYYKIPFPALILRNSFLVIEKKWREKIDKIIRQPKELFLSEQELTNRLVSRETKNEIRLNGNLTGLDKLYNDLKKQAETVDTTLGQHVEALKSRSVYRLQELEKKMLRAEKRKFADQQRQIHAVKEKLFPGGSLQERIDNFMYYYAKWGQDFIHQVYQHSLPLEREFVVLEEKL